MKRLLAASLATLLLASSAFAYTPNNRASNATASTMKLVPTKVVHPENLPRNFNRAIVTLEFSLDADGQPQRIEVVSRSDRAIREQVVKAFRQWKFEPAAAGIAERFVLPIEVVVPNT